MMHGQQNRTQGKQLGLMPSRTGLDFVLWLRPQPAQGDRAEMFVEATPDTEYHDPLKVKATFEPIFMLNREDIPADITQALRLFCELNMDLIEDYWFGLISSPSEVVRRVKRVNEAERSSVRAREPGGLPRVARPAMDRG